MDEINWLSLEDILYLHERSIQEHGGADGIREMNLLESALARPHNLHAYESVDNIHMLAAAYAESIARNHPFVDGNKRTAFAAADFFLFDNGFDLKAETGNEHTQHMESLAQGKISYQDMAEFLKNHSTAI